MKYLIRFLSMIFVVATILAALYFSWDYREHYSFWNTAPNISNASAQYQISVMSLEDQIDSKAPSLPDLTPYSVAKLEAKIPQIEEGVVSVVDLKDGFRKMRNRLTYFGEMQERLDPVVLVVESGVYNLAGLTKVVADPSVIEQKEDHTYILYVPLAVNAGATLLVEEGDTLLLSANHGALLTTFGDVFITKAEVRGWNVENNMAAAYKNSDIFRPYITAWCGAHLNIAQSKISSLGYQSSKAYGISYTSCTDTLYRDTLADVPGATGWIIDSEFRDVYFGFYSYEANDVVILGNLYEDNIVYGIDPHDRSKNLIIAHNTTRGSKEKHGIIISREVSHSFIFNNLTEDNAGSGIMLDRESSHNVVAYNTSHRNKLDGLTFYESPHNISYNNTLIYNGKSGMRIRNSLDITSQNDVINYNGDVAVQLYSSELASTRDVKMDPYTQESGVKIFDVEMVENKSANFKMEKGTNLIIANPKFLNSPKTIFSGDLNGIDHDVMNDLLGNGLTISKKLAGN